MNPVQEFLERQQEIDRLITPTIVFEIMKENEKEIISLVSPLKRVVYIVYMSTQSLHRKLSGQDDKPFKIVSTSFGEALQVASTNTGKKCKDLPRSICVCIGSYLPTGFLTGGNDSVYTHSFTCIDNIL